MGLLLRGRNGRIREGKGIGKTGKGREGERRWMEAFGLLKIFGLAPLMGLTVNKLHAGTATRHMLIYGDELPQVVIWG